MAPENFLIKTRGLRGGRRAGSEGEGNIRAVIQELTGKRSPKEDLYRRNLWSGAIVMGRRVAYSKEGIASKNDLGTAHLQGGDPGKKNWPQKVFQDLEYARKESLTLEGG